MKHALGARSHGIAIVILLSAAYNLWLYWASTQDWLLNSWSGRASLLIGGLFLGFLCDYALGSHWSLLLVPGVLYSVAAIIGLFLSIYVGAVDLNSVANYPLLVQPLIFFASVTVIFVVILVFDMVWTSLYVGIFAVLGVLLGMVNRAIQQS